MRSLYIVLGLISCAPFALAADTVVTPEPGTVVLLTAGLAGMGIAVWRRNRKK